MTRPERKIAPTKEDQRRQSARSHNVFQYCTKSIYVGLTHYADRMKSRTMRTGCGERLKSLCLALGASFTSAATAALLPAFFHLFPFLPDGVGLDTSDEKKMKTRFENMTSNGRTLVLDCIATLITQNVAICRYRVLYATSPLPGEPTSDTKCSRPPALAKYLQISSEQPEIVIYCFCQIISKELLPRRQLLHNHTRDRNHGETPVVQLLRLQVFELRRIRRL